MGQIAAKYLNIWLSYGGNMTPCIYELLATSRVHLKSQMLPTADLLLDVSPKAVAYLLVPPPQSLAQIAALHPNIWLSYPAKMASQVYGFYAARPPHCRLQSNVT